MRHKRSAARLISIPFPNSSSTMILDSPVAARPPSIGVVVEPELGDIPQTRFSSELANPNDGYSELFTSGLLRHQRLETHLPAKHRPLQPKPRQLSPQRPTAATSPHLLSPAPSAYPSTPLTPRRRSSVIHVTPGSTSPQKFKTGGPDSGVERALEGVMRSLKLATPKPPRVVNQTPPSRFSDDSEPEEGTPPRKSLESVRSRLTVRSTKSSRSLRKEKEKERDNRMEVDENIPPLPTHNGIGWMGGIEGVGTPQTPRKGRRVVDGLVRRLGLTPKKSRVSAGPPTCMPSNQVAVPPLPTPLPTAVPVVTATTVPTAPTVSPTFATAPAPTPPPATATTPSHECTNLPRKGSFSTLRSATKKGSATTLRSLRSIAQQLNGSTATLVPGDDIRPPLPTSKWLEENTSNGFSVPEGCFPTTPKGGRRTPKSSIGPPHLQPSTSPSVFLREMPRRAPQTPKQERDSEEDRDGRGVNPPVPVPVPDADAMDVDLGLTDQGDTAAIPALPQDETTRADTPTETDIIRRIEAVIAIEETIAFGSDLSGSNFSGLGGDLRNGLDITRTPAYTSRFKGRASPFTPELEHTPVSQVQARIGGLMTTAASTADSDGPRPSFDSAASFALSPDSESLQTPSSRPSTDESFGTFTPSDDVLRRRAGGYAVYANPAYGGGYYPDSEGTPLSARAMLSGQGQKGGDTTQPRKLLNLLNKPSEKRLGMNTPPAAILRGAKVSLGPGGGGLLAFRSKQGLNTGGFGTPVGRAPDENAARGRESTDEGRGERGGKQATVVTPSPSPSPYTRLLQVHSSNLRDPLADKDSNRNVDNGAKRPPAGGKNGWSVPQPRLTNHHPKPSKSASLHDAETATTQLGAHLTRSTSTESTGSDRSEHDRDQDQDPDTSNVSSTDFRASLTSFDSGKCYRNVDESPPVHPRGGVGSGTGTGSAKKHTRGNPSVSTFGRRGESRAGSHRSRPSVPDFTKSPPGSPGGNSEVVTEEWELEAYLKRVEG